MWNLRGDEVSEKLCTRCHKPHDEDTKHCAACKTYERDWKRQHPPSPEKKKEREEYEKQWRKDNPERVKAQRTAWKRNNLEKVKESDAKSYQKYKEEIQARRREFYKTHPDRYEATLKKKAGYQKTHPQVQKKAHKKWAKTHPETIIRLSHEYRARKMGAAGTFTIEEIKQLREKQGNRCYYCGDYLVNVHIEHKTPLIRGGSNDISNIALSCPLCNIRKHDMTEEEFLVVIR
jgi:hypothetical protein